MSRSALWRQEAGVKERERQAHDVFQQALEQGRNNRSKGLIPLFGSQDSFNLHPTLLQSTFKSPYFLKLCSQINDWNELVDQIYYEVKHVEPWSPGANKTPSTAFCLLLRLFTLRCTDKQMTLMLDHVDSPYIRCIGFLYLRYASDPKDLWNWVHPYIHDQERFQVSANASRPEISMGDYVRSLLNSMDYYETRLPRLPVAIERDIQVKLLQAERVEERACRHLRDSRVMEYFKKLGSKVRAQYEDEENPLTWYDAVIDRVITTDPVTREPLVRPKFVVTFPEYGNTETVTLGDLDMPGGGNEGPPRGDDGRGRHPQRGYDNRRHEHEDYRRDYDDKRGYDLGRGHWGRGNDSRRERSRSRDRDRDLMEEVLRREREKSTAKGRSYASRPPSTKASMSSMDDSRKRSAQEYDRSSPAKKVAAAVASLVTEKAAPKPKTAAELAAIAEKKRKLISKYG